MRKKGLLASVLLFSIVLRGQHKHAEEYFVEKAKSLSAQKILTDEKRNPFIRQIPSTIAATCSNLDFENGDFSSWTGGNGYNANTHDPLVITTASINSLGINSSETSCSPFTIVSTGNDPYGGFPMVAPGGGNYACRLGGETYNLACDYYNSNSLIYSSITPPPPNISTCTSNDPNTSNSASPNFGEAYSNGEAIQQTFSVTPSNSVFIYNYAIVFANPPHMGPENPYFSAQVFDQNGILIPYLSDLWEADSTGNGSTPPGFFVSSSLDALGNSVLYTPWTTKSLDLQPYIGTNVTVKFTTAGCTQGGHFAYAYIDCACYDTSNINSNFSFEQELESRLYPNPANSELNIIIPGNYKNCYVTITDIIGQNVRGLAVTKMNNRIETADLKSGVYFVKVLSDDKVLCTKKIIVQH